MKPFERVVNWTEGLINQNRRSFLKTVGACAAASAAGGLIGIGDSRREARAFAYEPYPRDDDLTTVVTSCDHNCGSRHMLVAHKKGDVIVRLSTDDGRYQAGGAYGFDTEQVPQLRGKVDFHELATPLQICLPRHRVSLYADRSARTWELQREFGDAQRMLQAIGQREEELREKLERLGTTVKRLEELYAEDGEIGFRVKRRTTSCVRRPDALRILEVPAS